MYFKKLAIFWKINFLTVLNAHTVDNVAMIDHFCDSLTNPAAEKKSWRKTHRDCLL
jgi:hypothetical protein